MINVFLAGSSMPYKLSDLESSDEFDYIKYSDENLDSHNHLDLECLKCRLNSLDGFFIALNESWVSFALALEMKLHFPYFLARKSRSKILQNCFINSPKREIIKINELAKSEIKYPAIIRPDSGYSSQGIYLLKSKNDIESVHNRIMSEQISSRYQRMKHFMNDNVDTYVVEAFVEGDEYSFDCVYKDGKFYLVRVCQKINNIIENKPITFGYFLLDLESSIYGYIYEFLYLNSYLFEKDKRLLFSMDIIFNNKQEIIPIDFAVRFGNDFIPELVLASSDYNEYLSAVSLLVSNNDTYRTSVKSGFALLKSTTPIIEIGCPVVNRFKVSVNNNKFPFSEVLIIKVDSLNELSKIVESVNYEYL